MSTSKSMERKFAGITMAAVMASIPHLGIDMSIAARITGIQIKELMEKSNEEIPYKKIFEYIKENFKPNSSSDEYDKLREILKLFREAVAKYSIGTSIEYSEIKDNKFELNIKNCFHSYARNALNILGINPPICIALGVTSALIEEISGKVLSIKDSTYDPETETCRHIMEIE